MGEDGGASLLGSCPNDPVSRSDPLGLTVYDDDRFPMGDKPGDICKCRKQCKPCDPKAGTPMYRVDRPPSRARGIDGKKHKIHTHHLVVTRRPVGAKVAPCLCETDEMDVTPGESQGEKAMASELGEPQVTLHK